MTNGGFGNQDDIDNVHKRVTDLEVYNSIIPVLPLAIIFLFLGAWSDAHGRKPILVISFVASSVMVVIHMLSYGFLYEMNVYFLLWDGVLGSFSGRVIQVPLVGYIGNRIYIYIYIYIYFLIE